MIVHPDTQHNPKALQPGRKPRPAPSPCTPSLPTLSSPSPRWGLLWSEGSKPRASQEWALLKAHFHHQMGLLSISLELLVATGQQILSAVWWDAGGVGIEKAR